MSSRNQSRSLCLRQFPSYVAALFGTLTAGVAQADWGENWSEMIWGIGEVPVPSLETWGLVLLPAVFLAIGVIAMAKRPRTRLTLLMLIAVAVPLTAYAGTVAVPNTFVNGTAADANEVNENFETLETESNDQDTRLDSLEGGAAALEESAEIDADISAHGASSSAHHTRYSDAEALAAAAGVDAGTLDGLDSTVLEESAEIDADIAAHAATAAAHHTRYTDGEALSAAAGVDAGMLDGIDSTGFATSAHAHLYGKVAVVAQSGGDYTDPKAAMDDVATWCGTPSVANPCLVRIMPGIYDLGNNALIMQSYVDIEGSGENTTTVTSTHSDVFTGTSATAEGASDAEIRFLTVDNQGGSDFSMAIRSDSVSLKITNVTATAAGGSSNYAVYSTGSPCPTLTNVTATASGGSSSFGVTNVNVCAASMTNVTATASGASTNNRGVHNGGASPIMMNVTATGSGGTDNEGVFNIAGSAPIIKGGVTSNGVLLRTAHEDATCAKEEVIGGETYRSAFCPARCDCVDGATIAQVDLCQSPSSGTVVAEQVFELGTCGLPATCMTFPGPTGVFDACTASSFADCTGLVLCADPAEFCSIHPQGTDGNCIQGCVTDTDCTIPEPTCSLSSHVPCVTSAECAVDGESCLRLSSSLPQLCRRSCANDAECVGAIAATLTGVDANDTTVPVTCDAGGSSTTINGTDALECIAQFEAAAGVSCN